MLIPKRDKWVNCGQLSVDNAGFQCHQCPGTCLLFLSFVVDNCETIATFKKHLDCLLNNRGYI